MQIIVAGSTGLVSSALNEAEEAETKLASFLRSFTNQD